jgi:hypothetical protein
MDKTIVNIWQGETYSYVRINIIVRKLVSFERTTFRFKNNSANTGLPWPCQLRCLASLPVGVQDNIIPPVRYTAAPRVSSSLPSGGALIPDGEDQPQATQKKGRRGKVAIDRKLEDIVEGSDSQMTPQSTHGQKRKSRAPAKASNAVLEPLYHPTLRMSEELSTGGKLSGSETMRKGRGKAKDEEKSRGEKKEKNGKKNEKKLPISDHSPAALAGNKMAAWDIAYTPSLAAAEHLVEEVRQHLSYRYHAQKVFLDYIPDTISARDVGLMFAGLDGTRDIDAVIILEAIRARERRPRNAVREGGPRTGKK